MGGTHLRGRCAASVPAFVPPRCAFSHAQAPWLCAPRRHAARQALDAAAASAARSAARPARVQAAEQTTIFVGPRTAPTLVSSCSRSDSLLPATTRSRWAFISGAPHGQQLLAGRTLKLLS